MIEYSFALIIFMVCLLFSGFFSGSEVALISINPAKVRTLVEQKMTGSKALEHLKADPDRLLITILIGNNLVNIAAASIATAVAIAIWGEIGIGIATFATTILMLTFGEILPKTYATRSTERVALMVSRPILWLSYTLYPLFWVIDAGKRIFSRNREVKPTVTEDEIKQWIDVGEEEGTIEEEEYEMLYRVFAFSDTRAKEVMTPRADVVMISRKSSLEDSINIFNETGFTRLPVYEEQIDNIIGILNVKDVFGVIYSPGPNADITDLVYEAYFVPESKEIDDLLREMQKRKIHQAIVVDEYGTFAGIVTVEDILEELVGEIMDEFDEEEPDIQKINDWVYLIDARAWVDRVNEELKTSLPTSESYETIGGLIIDQLGHIPNKGEVVTISESGIRLMVMKMNDRRIENIKLIVPMDKGIHTNR
ncbi:hemolysin family protein [Methanogenium organophilum]|uniref:Hemolysin family protein n=1 Tax=Methanogenium organophilum TaxID=2199 RepID=A0A9X9S2Q6_METOG|nr:hemolysin family protein [Methanogenium organophilum]WAI00723.1 hemolysin family protein [Methanogenium organophilum]